MNHFAISALEQFNEDISISEREEISLEIERIKRGESPAEEVLQFLYDLSLRCTLIPIKNCIYEQISIIINFELTDKKLKKNSINCSSLKTKTIRLPCVMSNENEKGYCLEAGELVSKGKTLFIESPFLKITDTMEMTINRIDTYTRYLINGKYDLYPLGFFLESLHPRKSNVSIQKISSSINDKIGNKEYSNRISFLAHKLQSNAIKVDDKTLAVYRLLSQLNHSCDPNCIVEFKEDASISLLALNDIEEGEELTISYNNNLIKHKDRNRKQKIKRHLDFDCLCKKCIKNK